MYRKIMLLSSVLFGVSRASLSVGVVGEDAYLNWTISNLSTAVNRAVRNPTDSASLILFFPDSLYPSRLSPRVTYTGDLTRGILSFVLANVTVLDSGRYKFVQSGLLGGDVDLGGQVLVVAESPNVLGIIALSLPAVEGQEYKLNCSAESRSVPLDHNLTMYSYWKENGVNITGGSKYTINMTILIISNLDRKDNGAMFTCSAFEDQRRISAESNEFFLNILYGPDAGGIILFPNQRSYELTESSSLSVNCSADCYPYCQYRWTGPGGGNYGNTGVLSVSEIKRNQTGVFTCRATNPSIASIFATANISVTVFYGPDTPMQLYPGSTSYRLLEGTTIPDINCTSICFPSCEFQWTGPVSSLTGIISLGKVNRSLRGNYACRGQNPRTQTQTYSSVVTVIIIYGPDTPVLTPSTIEYTLNESNILPDIQCSSECFPGCTTYWYREQTRVPGIQADILSLGIVYRNDSGTYTCKSENMESRATGEKVIQLVVQYPPTVSIESRNGSFSQTGLTINCTARGIPERYIYSLIHSSLFSGIKIRQLIENEPGSTGVLVHWFRNPSFMDTGVYTCIVRNGILDYRDGSIDKSVSQTVWIRGPPNVISSETDFYAEKGCPGRLVIEFYSSPLDANVMWNKQINQTLQKLESSDKYNMSLSSITVTVKFYSILIQQPGFIATLEIQNMTEEDFSSYQVYLQNSAGIVSDLILHLRPRGYPDVPNDVHVVPNSITSSSVNIEWVSGFHGGSNQTFVIEYKTQMDEHWTTYSHDVFGGMMQNKYFNITVVNLRQNTFYFFQLYAWNVLGRSVYSTTVNATTYAEIRKPASRDNGASSVIIGGVLGTCIPVAFLVIVVVVLLYRRRRLCSDCGKSSRQIKTSRSATAEGKILEGYTTINTVASTGGDHYANLCLDLQDTEGEMNENLNMRSSNSVTYDALHPYANNEEHAYSSLNQRPHQKGENFVYENTNI